MQKPSIRRGYADMRFGQLHYYWAAPGDQQAAPRRPLVMIHQTTVSACEFGPLIPEMARDRPVIAVDLPGYGGSDGPSSPIAIQDYAEALAAALSQIEVVKGAPQFDVLGAHGGSLVGSELALIEPERIGRLALMGVADIPGEERDRFFASIFDRHEMPNAILTRVSNRLNAAIERGLPAGLDARQLAAISVESLRSLDRRWFLFDSSWRYDVRGRLSKIACPVLLLVMDDDLKEASLRSASIFANATVLRFDDALSILPFYCGCETVAAALRAFLDQAPESEG